MTYRHRIRVRYGEVDPQNVVFNAHWLAYFDDAMVGYLDHVGISSKQMLSGVFGYDAMVVKSVLEWQGSATFEDEVDIEVRPSRLGSSSFDLSFTARVDGREVVTATTTYVCIVHGQQRSTPIPDDLRKVLEADLPAH